MNWTGKMIYGMRGTSAENMAGLVTGSTRPCQMEGCKSNCVMVRWPDGRKTWPCSSGIAEEGDHLRISSK